MPFSQPYNWTFRRVVWATLVLVSVAFTFLVLYRFNQVVFILFIAIVMGTVVRPVVTWLYKRGLSRLAGVILVYLIIFGLLISFMLLFFPLILKQGTTIVAAVPGYYQNLREWMVNNTNQWIVRLSEFLPATLTGLEPMQQTGQQVLASAGQALGYVMSAAKLIFIAIAILLLAFHWTLNGPRIIQSLLLLVPKSKRQNIGELISAMETKIGFYIAGQGVLCLVIGLMALVTYLLIGLPNALALAFVMGVLEAVPMIGPFLGAIPAVLIALSIAPSKFVMVIVATLIIQQMENSFLVPHVMRRAVGVNPFVSLLAVFAFSSLFGIPGTLMAIPLAAIIQLLLYRFVFNPISKEPFVPTKVDYASQLRYEAKILAQDLRKQAQYKKRATSPGFEQIDMAMDEIEAITTDLESLLAKVPPSGKT